MSDTSLSSAEDLAADLLQQAEVLKTPTARYLYPSVKDRDARILSLQQAAAMLNPPPATAPAQVATPAEDPTSTTSTGADTGSSSVV